MGPEEDPDVRLARLIEAGRPYHWKATPTAEGVVFEDWRRDMDGFWVVAALLSAGISLLSAMLDRGVGALLGAVGVVGFTVVFAYRRLQERNQVRRLELRPHRLALQTRTGEMLADQPTHGMGEIRIERLATGPHVMWSGGEVRTHDRAEAVWLAKVLDAWRDRFDRGEADAETLQRLARAMGAFRREA
jgi:hypothetical protein